MLTSGADGRHLCARHVLERLDVSPGHPAQADDADSDIAHVEPPLDLRVTPLPQASYDGTPEEDRQGSIEINCFFS